MPIIQAAPLHWRANGSHNCKLTTINTILACIQARWAQSPFYISSDNVALVALGRAYGGTG